MFVINKTCIICYEPIFLSLNYQNKSCDCKYYTHRRCIMRYIETTNRNTCLMCNQNIEIITNPQLLNKKQVRYIKVIIVFLYSLIILIELYRLTHIVSKKSWEYSSNLSQIEEPVCMYE